MFDGRIYKKRKANDDDVEEMKKTQPNRKHLNQIG